MTSSKIKHSQSKRKLKSKNLKSKTNKNKKHKICLKRIIRQTQDRFSKIKTISSKIINFSNLNSGISSKASILTNTRLLPLIRAWLFSLIIICSRYKTFMLSNHLTITLITIWMLIKSLSIEIMDKVEIKETKILIKKSQTKLFKSYIQLRKILLPMKYDKNDFCK